MNDAFKKTYGGRADRQFFFEYTDELSEDTVQDIVNKMKNRAKSFLVTSGDAQQHSPYGDAHGQKRGSDNAYEFVKTSEGKFETIAI